MKKTERKRKNSTSSRVAAAISCCSKGKGREIISRPAGEA